MLFNNLNFSEELQKEIFEVCTSIKRPKNDILVREGDLMMYLPFVKDGIIKVYKEDADLDRELLLYYVEAGQTCMMSLVASLKDHRSMVNARMEEDSEIILIPIRKVQIWRQEFDEWNAWILDIFLERYAEVMDTIKEITFNNIEERLAKYLARMAGQHSLGIIEATHLEIANTLGTTRVVISRILKKMESKGKITLYRGRIQLNQ